MISFFDNIPLPLYHPIYILGLFFCCMIVCISYSLSETNQRIIKALPANQLFATLFALLIIVYIGFRPISGKYFTDMLMYAHTYNNIYDGFQGGTDDSRGEWLFYWLGNTCKRLGLIDREYFLVLSTIYFGLMAATCLRLMRNNMFVALLFCFISFSCFSFGTNGMRNGTASSVMMLAITFLNREKK